MSSLDRLTKIDVGISADECVQDEILDEFVQSLEEVHLRLEVERRPATVFAGIEWFLPTLVVLFLSRKLFDSLMTEAGKDIYKVVKEAVLRLLGRTSEQDAEVRAAVIVSQASPKKSAGRSPTVLSIWAILDDGSRVTFIFPADLKLELHEAAVEGMLALLKEHYMGACPPPKLGIRTEHAFARWGTLPLIIDHGAGTWNALIDSDTRRDV